PASAASLARLVPVGEVGARLPQQGWPPRERERRPHGRPACAGVDHAVRGQPFTGVMKGALDSGRPGLVRADMQQAGARRQRQVVRNHPVTLPVPGTRPCPKLATPGPPHPASSPAARRGPGPPPPAPRPPPPAPPPPH